MISLLCALSCEPSDEKELERIESTANIRKDFLLNEDLNELSGRNLWRKI
jgi:hypothetical protein